MICLICNRLMVAGPSINDHHLIPRTFKGTETITIHAVCHDKLHHTFSEREMYQYYHTIDRIKSHPEIEKFVAWVSKKDPEFYIKHKDSNNRKRQRKH